MIKLSLRLRREDGALPRASERLEAEDDWWSRIEAEAALLSTGHLDDDHSPRRKSSLSADTLLPKASNSPACSVIVFCPFWADN
jgi:hypothetical protein